MSFVTGDIVTRNSYSNDVLFRINHITNHVAVLYGEDIRLEADAALTDLKKVQEREMQHWKSKEKEKADYSFRLFRQDYQLMKEKRNYESTAGYHQDANYFQIPARVLHLDGDKLYLKKCIDLYQRLGLQVHGLYCDEREMPGEMERLITKIQPDMIVITGHDAFLRNKGEKKDIRAYRHSQYFVDAVRAARNVVPNVDQLVIFAGACQSHFESLIRAGANFASSPSRINIHALDPVYIAAKVAYTSFMEKVSVYDALKNTLTGEKGLGGIETKGLLRTGMPYVKEDLN
ncbi:sporulation peptidase YabG [Paraliobacillus salinarum]|uniref:sporulation peptidase YabG n=1 Tax=Paraliobacillus salinarum TaxID=1158996 RepID=UPI0015F60094|nr:sporulation peptidase YabG [Paraliobacillus salinarum]